MLSERRISLHTNHEGETVGISIDPSLFTESALEELTTGILKHGAKPEEILLFRRGAGLTHVTEGDLLDLRLMFRHGDHPWILVEGVNEEFKKSRRAAKKPTKTQKSF